MVIIALESSKTTKEQRVKECKEIIVLINSNNVPTLWKPSTKSKPSTPSFIQYLEPGISKSFIEWELTDKVSQVSLKMMLEMTFLTSMTRSIY